MAFTETSTVQGMMAIAEKLHSRLLRVVKLTITSFVDNFINSHLIHHLLKNFMGLGMQWVPTGVELTCWRHKDCLGLPKRSYL